MKKTLTITLLIIGIVFTMSIAVLATTPDLNELINSNNENLNTVANTNNENQNINVNTNINTNTNTNSNVNNQNNVPEKLVNTGISVNIAPIIAIIGIASIYAYKKVKEYNV